MYISVCVTHVCRCLKRASDLKLEIEAVVSYLMWVYESNPGPLARAANQQILLLRLPTCILKTNLSQVVMHSFNPSTWEQRQADL